MGRLIMQHMTNNNSFYKKENVFNFLEVSNQFTSHKLTNFEARVAIRFMRIGRIHEPFYRIIAVDSRRKRDTEPIEFLGWYNPKTKEANLNAPEIKKWLSFGAQPSDRLKGLFKRAAIIKIED